MSQTAVPPFGLAVAVALTLGALLGLGWPQVLPSNWLLPILAVALLLWLRARRGLRVLALVLLGFAWAQWQMGAALAARLPESLLGQEFSIAGRIVALPERLDDGWRFILRVEQAPDAVHMLYGQDLRLRSYASQPELAAGERWRMQVRLRPPRALRNPGGFDFERYALQRGLVATGYVSAPTSMQRLTRASGIHAWRDRLARRLGGAEARFVKALAVGDTRDLDDSDWDRLRAAGLTHLFAISGFHVGLLAGFGIWLQRLLYFAWPTLARLWPRPQAEAVAAFVAASAYTAAAGFALPTVRTLLMISVVLLARLLRRPAAPSSWFALALLAVVLVDPLVLLTPGFWLSFVGVAWLLWCLPQRVHPLASLLRAQVVMTLGLLPLGVWFFAQASLIGPLANLVAVPWISLCVVPLSLLAGVLVWVNPAWVEWATWPARASMDLLWAGVARASAWPTALYWLPEPALWAMLLALLGVLWLLLPRGLPGRWLGAVLCLPLLLPARERLAPGAIGIEVFDVGQGLAVRVHTRTHELLYDTGPAVPGRFDVGEMAVVPALHALAVRQLDVLVLSHGDADHAGGAAAVRRAFAPLREYAPAGYAGAGQTACVAGVEWMWDGVRFAFLHPPAHFPYLRNESSCVLRIEGAFGRVLLPGDIGALIEQRLVREQGAALAADVVLVPHHGSAASSSREFVAAVAPRIAVFATGYANRFGFPREQSLVRWQEVTEGIGDTARDGMLSIRLDADGVRVSGRWRPDHRRAWHMP